MPAPSIICISLNGSNGPPKRLIQPQKYKKNFSQQNETRNKFRYLGYFHK